MNTQSKLTRITKRSFREGYHSYDLLVNVYGTVMDTLHKIEENIAKEVNPDKYRIPTTGNYNIANQGKHVIIACYEVTLDGVIEPITLRMFETRVNHDLDNRSNATGITYSTTVYIKRKDNEDEGR